MSFHHPWLLLLLAIVPVAVWFRYRRSRRAAVRFSDNRVLQGLPRSPAVVAQPLLPILYGLGLALLVVAMARPQRGLAESVIRTEAVDIVLLVDVSTSMLAEDFATGGRSMNRLDAAKEVMERFVNRRTQDRIGMVAFAAMPYSVAPLTLDHGWLILQMERLKAGMLEDGTAIGSAIGSAVNRLRESEAKSKLVVLLTDGMNNAGTLSPDNAAQTAKALGIRIYTVGAGTSGWVRMPVDDPILGRRFVRHFSEIDEATLQRVADTTGGSYFRAADLQTLNKVYDQIDAMEKTEMQVENFTRFEERFAPFLLASLILLGLEQVMGMTWLGRLP